MQRNRIHDGQTIGVRIYEGGQGTLQENDIFGNAGPGVEIAEESDPVLRANRIHDGQSTGVLIRSEGRGTLEENEISGNTRAGVEITSGAGPVLRRNRIHDGTGDGVWIHTRGRGLLEENDIVCNADVGVEINQGGDPVVRRNRIRENLCGIFVHDKGEGTLADNDVTQNAFHGVRVTDSRPAVLGSHTLEGGGAVWCRRHGRGLVREAWVELLESRGEWVEMWRLAQQASPQASAAMLVRLGETGWTPADRVERMAFDRLVSLARPCAAAPRDSDVLIRRFAALREHRQEVNCLAFSSDGRFLASGGGFDLVEQRLDSHIRVWSLPDGALLHTLEGHTGQVEALGLSPDGRMLASAGWLRDRTVRLWSLPDGQPLGTLEKAMGPFAFSPDSRLLAVGAGYDSVLLCGLPDGRPIQTLKGQRGSSSCLAFSPCGEWLAGGGSPNGDFVVALWSIADRKLHRRLEGHTGQINALAISPDGRLLASGSDDKTVRLWSLPEGTPLATLTGHSHQVLSLVISSCGRLMASASMDDTVRLWRLPHGKAAWRFRTRLYCVLITPDGRMLFGTTRGRTVHVRSLADGRLMQALDVGKSSAKSLALSPSGRILVTGHYDGSVRLWDLAVLGDWPVAEATQADLVRIEEWLVQSDLSEAQRHWLQFVEALIGRRLASEVI